MIERKSPLRVWSLAVTSIALALVVGSLWTEAAAWQEPPPSEQESPAESTPTSDPEAQEPTESPAEEGGEQDVPDPQENDPAPVPIEQPAQSGGEQDVPQEEDPAPDPIGGEQEASTGEGASPQEVEPPTSGNQAQPVPEPGSPETLADLGEEAEDPKQAAHDAAVDAANEEWGLLVLLPAGIAILLAILTRQVVISLAAGVLVGAFMVVPLLPHHPELAEMYGDQNIVIAGLRLFVEHYLMQALTDPGKVMILVFTLAIGFMIGVIGENGGTRGLVKVVVGNSPSRRKGALMTWLAGLVVFFDDYANTMIVGPTMRSVFDKVKLSRAKLAYIVDSTAAPVASIALIGTWVGAEVGYIGDGLAKLGSDVPAFLQVEGANGAVTTISAMTAFLESLCYRFYPILALILVFIVALTGRDFGPMRKAEQRAFDDDEPLDDDEFHSTDVPGEDAIQPRPWLGVLPILVLVATSMIVLWQTGTTTVAEQDQAARDKTEELIAEARAENPAITLEEIRSIEGSNLPGERDTWEFISLVVSNADSYVSILYGAIISAIVAVLLSILARAGKISRLGEAGVQGMTHMFPALIILVLAWCLSAIAGSLFLGDIVSLELAERNFDARFAPLAIFLCAAVISFSSGTSWGTMGILCPTTVIIVAKLGADLDPDAARELFYASVGSVLAGAIFGDHCSPISDTTVLSSVSAGCTHEEHVWTQIPYALLTAVVAMGVGDFGCRYFDQPWYVGIAAGIVVLFLFMFLFGRKPKQSSKRSTDAPRRSDEGLADTIRYRTEDSV